MSRTVRALLFFWGERLAIDNTAEMRYIDSIVKCWRGGAMGKIRQFFGNLIIRFDKALYGKEPTKTLQVIFQFNRDFDILADYLSWPPEEHDMFRRVYPLTHSVRAIHEAVEFAKDHGYDLLRIDTVERGESPRTLRVVYVRTLKEVLYE